MFGECLEDRIWTFAYEETSSLSNHYWLAVRGRAAIGFIYHASEFRLHPFQYEVVWVCLVRLIAILSGVFILRGRNWARWLLVIWIAYHAILSAFHSVSGVITHGLLLLVIAYFLFRSQASPYFSSSVTLPDYG
jgi:hypothetical protein